MNSIGAGYRWLEIVTTETSQIFKRLHNNIRLTLWRHPFLGLEIWFRLTSPFHICPYKWNPEKNLLILSRNSGRLAVWNVLRMVYLCFSIFIISRSIWFLPRATLLSQFISWLWISIYVTGSWFNIFYFYKREDFRDVVNSTVKVAFTYNPGGKHGKKYSNIFFKFINHI